MLLFSEHSKALILMGRKIQTRRVWRRPRVKPGHVYQCRTELLGKPFANIRVLSVEPVRLGWIDEEDARAEGAASVEEFVEVWRRIHMKWEPWRWVWKITFEVVGR